MGRDLTRRLEKLEEDALPADLPEGVREHFERMDPDEQPARERWLRANWSAAKERREHWRRYFSDEQVRARREESERRDRELLARNRGEGDR